MKVEAENKRKGMRKSEKKKQGFRVIVRHSKRLEEGRAHGLASIKHMHNS